MPSQRPTTRTPGHQGETISQASLLRNGPLLALGAGHGAVDLCANILPVFYPMLVATLGISYAAIGVLSAVQVTFSSVGQPFFGWLADRFGSRAVAPLSVLAAFAGAALIGFASGYYALLAVVSLLGLGVGAYHPQGARAAAILGGRWRTTALSIYMVGGSAGYALGPLLAATLLAPAGLRSSVALLLPGMLVSLALFATIGRVDRTIVGHGARARSGTDRPIRWGAVVALGWVIVLRAWVNSGLIAFLPLLYAERQEAPALAGQILFLVLFTEGFGTALGGWLADRIGLKLTLVASFLAMVPVAHLFLDASGPWLVVLAIVLGLLLGNPVTVTLAAAQDIVPSRMAMVSGIAISTGNIMGAVGVALLGVLADQYGLEPSVEILVFAVLAAAVASAGVRGREG